MRSDLIVRAAAVFMAWMCLGTAAVFICKVYDTEKQDRESADAYEAILEQVVRHGEPGEGPAPAVPEVLPTSGEELAQEDVSVPGGVFRFFEGIYHGSDVRETGAGEQGRGGFDLNEFISNLADLVRVPGRTGNADRRQQSGGLVTDASVIREQNDGEPATEDYQETGVEADPETGQEAAHPGGEASYDYGQEVDMDYLRTVNSDIVGWLYCPGTVINYPVVQGNDNSYYLTHLADGSENRNGSLFIDCDNAADLSDENTIIYGHHMQSGAMFASLVKYADQAYYEAHPYMYLDVGDVQYLVEVFAGYDAAVDDDAYCRTFACEKDFAEWLGQVKAKSDFSADVKVAVGDRVISLSTCSYGFEDARYVVHGKLLLLS